MKKTCQTARNRWDVKVWKDATKLPNTKNGHSVSRNRVTGGRKQGRPWAGNGVRSHRRKRRRRR
jgi:hypothetical protein